MFTLLLPVLTLALCISAAPSNGNGKVIYVNAGSSIQAAINSAKPGSCIIVSAGTYHEQLTIGTSGLSLISNGAIIYPPATPVSNTCSGLAGSDTEAGICVTGSNIALAAFESDHRKVESVGAYVEDVSITGFEIHGFGINIAVVGGKDVKAAENTLYDGAAYGFLAAGSLGTVAVGNKVTTTDTPFFIGMCMDDSSPAKYIGNHVSGYLIAFCMQTSGGIVKKNIAESNCVGAFLDPGVQGAVFADNIVKNLDPRCPPSSPDFAVGGVVIFGSIGATITGNTFTGMKANQTAAGVLVADAPGFLATRNIIKGNVLSDNDVDIFLFTNATDNVIADNRCATSVPAGLCSL
jgi:hypothetical protein